MNQLSITCNKIANEDVEYKTFEGQKYLTAPVIIVQEQVLNGELLTANELSKYVAAWNGVPVTVPHPTDEKGRKISANASPKVLEKYQVGRVFNVFYDKQNKQLKGEVWINEDKVSEVSKGEKAIKIIKANKPLDVSSGYFSDTTNESGYHKGQKFNGKQYNLRPDHLALLPNSKGACSWQDGCGIRANEGGDNIETNEETKGILKRLLDSLTSMEEDIVDNELSDRDVRSRLRKKLAERFGGNNIEIRVREVFPDYVIFKEVDRRSDREVTLYQIEYSRGDEEVKLGDEIQEVERKVEYQPVNNEEVNDMKVNEDDGKEDIIANVLDNECNKLTESTLEAMSEEELKFYAEGLECNEENETEESADEEVEETEEGEDVETNNLQKAINQALEPVTNKLEELEEEVNQNKMEEKRPYIDVITNSDENPFPEEELKDMCVDRLESLSKAFSDDKVVDYSGLGGPRTNNNDDEEDYEGPTINDLKSKEAK